MSSDVVIRAQGVAKTYQMYASPRDRLKQLVFGGRRRYYEPFEALADVSFEVRRGESLGIIGRNGSGKSTLLQILCGTMSATAGSVRIEGRVAAMLELGSGFDPEFTGRENVFLNAELLGLTPQQAQARYASICEFADIGDFIDHPVKTYSSGMQVRLAFAVMAHVDADVLVIDEALAVGDALFTQKCMRFLRAYRKRGTLLFVTHDTSAVMSLCDRALWLDHGHLIQDGSSKAVCEAYLQYLFESVQGRGAEGAEADAGTAVPAAEALPAGRGEAAADTPSRGAPDGDARGADRATSSTVPATRDPRLAELAASVHRNEMAIFEFDPDAPSFGRGGARIVDIAVEDPAGRRLALMTGGEPVVVVIDVEALEDLAAPIVGFLVRDRLGQNLFGDNTFLTPGARRALPAGARARARFAFDLPLLPPGDYSINVAIADGTQHEHVQHEWRHDALLFHVETSSIRHALVGLPMHSIEFEATAPSAATDPGTPA